MSDYVPESALVIAAHPDDIEFICAGTVIRWTRAGARVVYVICTSGEAGVEDPEMSLEGIREMREEEARQAARMAGVEDVVFLREPDGLVESTLELRRKLVGQVRRVRPEVVICGDPTLLWMGPRFLNHPDHRAVATAAMDAVWPTAGQPRLYPEFRQRGWKAHRPRKLYVTGWLDPTGRADTWVDVKDTLSTKIKALDIHSSQTGDVNNQAFLTQLATQQAAGQDMELAETFRVVTFIPDEVWEATRGARGD